MTPQAGIRRDEDVTAVRRAARQLEVAVAALTRHFGDTVDLRRLTVDASRISIDLDLLCGPPAAATTPSPPPVREVIPDSSYRHDFWMDAEDEGLGSSDQYRR